MSEQDLKDLMDEFVKRGPPKFTHILVDEEHGAIEIFLEDCSHYGEWLEGEGADMYIFRANNDGENGLKKDRVVGARLPLKHSSICVHNLRDEK